MPGHTTVRGFDDGVKRGTMGETSGEVGLSLPGVFLFATVRTVDRRGSRLSGFPTSCLLQHSRLDSFRKLRMPDSCLVSMTNLVRSGSFNKSLEARRSLEPKLEMSRTNIPRRYPNGCGVDMLPLGPGKQHLCFPIHLT